MAQMFLSESSRRTQQIPEEEMNDRWAMAFGERKPQSCSKCGKVVHETKNGLCADCQREASSIKVETHVCVECQNVVIRINDLGLCVNCAAIKSMEEPGRYNGE